MKRKPVKESAAVVLQRRKLSWLRGFLEMMVAGDGLIGATPSSRELRAKLDADIEREEARLAELLRQEGGER